RQVHGKGSEASYGKGNQSCDDDAKHSANPGHDPGFHQKLEKDIPARGAQRFAHADLAGSFRDACEHYVHNHDAPDDQENGDYNNRTIGERARQVVIKLHDGRGLHHAEGVVLFRCQMPAGSHQHAGLVFRRLHQVGGDRLDVEVQAGFAAVHLAPDLNENVNKTVLRLPEGAAHLLGHADDRVRLAIDVNRFAQRIDAAKEALGHVRADHGHIGAVDIVGLADVPANGRFLLVNANHVGAHAADIDILNRFGLIFDLAQVPHF